MIRLAWAGAIGVSSTNTGWHPAPASAGMVAAKRGALEGDGHAPGSADALLLDGERCVTLANGVDAEVLVFDLAP